MPEISLPAPEWIIRPSEHSGEGAKAYFFSTFYSEKKSKSYFNYLREEINWRKDELKMFGKTHSIPRYHAWYGDAGAEYSYSKIKLERNDWSKELLEIKKDLEEALQYNFHGVLLNYYESGDDYMSWHSDNEKEMGIRPLLASLSFGAQRNFTFRHKASAQKKSLSLASGSLLVMEGTIQEFWQHQLPRSKKVSEGRINLTFRPIK